DKLIENYPEIKELISREDYLHIMVNGIHINSLQQFKTKLNENDKVAIFPPVSGG
ncbi:MAG TPA: MoaD/ThiS family protein, partial [Archaeoglobaceae archaeon]|nr:MoaD/ThiS family protein [Archaeoglobaceae archaeon]